MLENRFLLLLMALGAPSAFSATYDNLSPSTMSFRIGTTTPVIPLTLQAPKNSSLGPLMYNQNANSKVGLGLDYSWLGFFVSVGNMESELDKSTYGSSTYGSSTYSDFQLHSYLGALGVDIFYQEFKGYYLQNTQEVMGETCCDLRDDLVSRFLGVNLFLVLKPDRLSMGTTNNLTGVQKQSGGSWMLFGSAGVQEITSGSVLAPEGFESDYGLIGNAKSAEFATAAAGAGYGYTGMISGSFFIHITGLMGIGPQWQNLVTRDNGRITETAPAAKVSMRSTLGWSGKSTFGGVQVLFDSTNFQLKEEVLTFNSVLSFLSIGFRI